MFNYVEKIARVTETRTVETGKWFTLEVDYITAGGVKKTLAIPHSDAAWLTTALVNELDSMPAERKRRSFFASLKRNR